MPTVDRSSLDVIASRTYSDGPNGPSVLLLHLCRPIRDEPGSYRCIFLLSPEPFNKRSAWAFGIDAIDALVSALKMARVHVEEIDANPFRGAPLLRRLDGRGSFGPAGTRTSWVSAVVFTGSRDHRAYHSTTDRRQSLRRYRTEWFADSAAPVTRPSIRSHSIISANRAAKPDYNSKRGHRKMQRQFDVVVERASEGCYVASVPQLAGCHTQARSLAELNTRIREAIELCLEVEGVPEEELEFIGIQRVTIAA